MRWTPILTIAALVLAGCAAEEPKGDETTTSTASTTGSTSAVPPSSTSSSTTSAPTTTTSTTTTTGPTSNGPTTNTTTNTTTGPPETMVFSGSVVVPDPVAVAGGFCILPVGMSDVSGPGDVVGNHHEFGKDLGGWTYAFDVPGILADFWDDAGPLEAGSGGTVPAGATRAFVCGDDPAGAASDYTLTLVAAT